MKKHNTKHIKWEDNEADVDEEIADLILNCWKLDINTYMSCQNNEPKDWAWVQFDIFGGQEFLNICANDFDDEMDSLYNRVTHSWSDNNGSKKAMIKDEFWQYSVDPMDLSVHFHEDEEGELDIQITGEPDIIMSFSVRFPRKDTEAINALLAQRIEEQESVEESSFDAAKAN